MPPIKASPDDGYVTVTIDNGASLSSAANLGTSRILGIIVPTWGSAAAITFQVSIDDVTYYEAFDETGAAVTIPSGTHNKAYPMPLNLLGFPYVKVRSGTSGSPVAQSGGRDVTLVVG